jgi:hypothetical protein
MEANEADQLQPTARGESSPAAIAASADGSAKWYRRAPFWRAVAGMALAITLGCIAVALETSFELSDSSARYHRRISQLSLRINRMRGEIASADRELASMRTEVAARDSLNRIRAAPDASFLRLAPPIPGETATALVAISRHLGRAVLEVSGLPPPRPAQTYILWWMLDGGASMKAAVFHTGADDRATIIAQLPTHGSIAAGMVTVEPESGADKPSGAVKLKGVTRKAEVKR